MKKAAFPIALLLLILLFPCHLPGEELPKLAVWDLEPRNIPAPYAKELTSILASEINKLQKYEVYSQENVRTLAGWTEERMKLGCTSSQCLTVLGQMDIAKLISGSVGKIGNRYSVSLNLFDTKNARAENMLSDFCRSEDELIDLLQQIVRNMLGGGAAVKSSPTSTPSPTRPSGEFASIPKSSISAPGPTFAEYTSAGPWRPGKPITAVVGWAVGSLADITARISEPFLSRRVGLPIVIVNKPGGGGSVAGGTVADSKPDGYTLLFGYGGAGEVIYPHLNVIPINPLRDLVPVCRLHIEPLFLYVGPNGPKSLGQFIELAKNGRVTGATLGPGSSSDILLGAFAAISGLRITRVPYRGFNDAVVATLEGHVHCAALPYPEKGKLIPIAVALDQRNPLRPNVPTFKELGYDLGNLWTHNGVAAPRGTPSEVIQFLSYNFKMIAENSQYVENIQGKLEMPVMYMGPQAFGAALKATFEDYGKWIRQLGIK